MTQLLTGASGVVGSEVIRNFPANQLLLGRHRAVPKGSSSQVSVDIREPMLGLSKVEYRKIADKISGIIHSAAITDMNGVVDGLNETNIDGVRNIISLAQAADVPLHYISTAYCSKSFGPKHPAESPYVKSKQAAEVLVRQSGLDWTIIRPSIVIGHSQTGSIANFQGFHLLVNYILKGRLPCVPIPPGTRCDFIPVDYVAKAIDNIVTTPEYGQTYWLTGGNQAITIDEMIRYGQPYAMELGNDLSELPICDPHSEDFNKQTSQLSRRMQERVDMLVELCRVMTTERPFPTDFAKLLPDTMTLNTTTLLTTLGHNLHFWGSANRHQFVTKA